MLPVMVSPITNRVFALMNILSSSSTRITDVAFEVPPVMVSPGSNLPVVPLPLSNTILSALLDPDKFVPSKTK